MENTNTKNRRARNKVPIPYHVIVEMFFAALIAAAISLDVCVPDKLQAIGVIHSTVLDIVSILLPMVITVISITLEMAKEKICGVARTDFNKLRSGWHYSFLWMMFIAIDLFASSACFCQLSLSLSTIASAVVAFVYAILFSVQEIPLMKHDQRKINRIIKNYYLWIANNGNNRSNSEEARIFSDVITYLLFVNGLKDTFFTLRSPKKDDAGALDYLLDRQNKYFSSLIESKEVITKDVNLSWHGVNVLSAIERGYENLNELLSGADGFAYSSIYGNQHREYLMAMAVFTLHGISGLLGLETKERRSMNSAACLLLRNVVLETKMANPSIALLSVMTISTVQRGEMWFLKTLRDANLSYALYGTEAKSLGVFLIVYCFCLISQSTKDNDAVKGKIIAFLNEPCGVFDGESMISHVGCLIDNGDDKKLSLLLGQLLEDYDAYDDDNTAFLSGEADASSLGFDNGFSQEIVIDCWLEIVLSEFGFHIEEKEKTKKAIETLSDANQGILSKRLADKWLDDRGELKPNVKIGFLAFLGLKSNTPLGSNKKTLDALKEFKEAYNLEKTEENIGKQNVSDEELNKYKQALKDAFVFACAKIDLTDESIDLASEPFLHLNMRFSTKGIDQLISAYSEDMRETLLKYASQTIKKMIAPVDEDEEGFVPEEIAKKVLAFSPDCQSMRSSLKYLVDDEIRKELEKIKQSNIASLPSDLYWKGKAIRVKFEYDDSKSEFRRLSQNEIDWIIDQEYAPINGLYKYHPYSNGDFGSFWVTKEKLSEIIGKTTLLSSIVFRFKAIVESNDILWIGNNWKHKT